MLAARSGSIVADVSSCYNSCMITKHQHDIPKKKRLLWIDFLKVVGLTGIIIAHVSPPNDIFMLRSFDVPLMVIISSLLAEHSYKKYEGIKNGYLKYAFSRFKRLVIPTWIFLTLYFVIRAILTKEIFDPCYYLDTYLLTRYGFGYVWIILIYLYSALLVPLFSKIRCPIKTLLIIMPIYVIYEILFHYEIGTDIKIIDTTFYYIIPYGLLTYLGYNFNNFSKKAKYIIIAISGLIFTSLVVYYAVKTGSFQLVQIAKYPPRLYYLSYGIFCSFALLLICQKVKQKYFEHKIIDYISKHTMWIYLWHILVLGVYDAAHLPDFWILRFALVYLGSVLMVMAVNKLLDLIEKKKKIQCLIYLRG